MQHFVIAGCQRSGSTWLARVLDEHPQIELAKPLRPEPKVFLDDTPLSQADYRARFFAAAGDDTRALGEKSVTYVERPDAIARIQAVLPDALVIFVLRDPVERAFSNWRFSVESGLETLSFEDALEAEAARAAKPPPGVSTNPFAYVERGHYAAQLEPWLDAFHERAVVLLFEEVREDLGAVRELYQRLGAAPDFDPPAFHRPANASADDARMQQPTRARLHEHFREPNQRLADLLGRSLTPWR